MLSGRTIKERALDLGFDLAGIAPADAWKDLEFSRQWVEKGYHGEMRYLENPKRFDPFLALPSTKSVICAGLVYNSPLPYSTDVDTAERNQEVQRRRQKAEGRTQKAEGSYPWPSLNEGWQTTTCHSEPVRFARNDSRFQDCADFPFSISAPKAWISRYAWGRDYHEIMRARLKQLRAAIKESAPEAETRVFVDTGPVLERAFARFSGIGWMGKNTCIINQEQGSWLFLGIILTSLELAPDLPAPDRCGSCTACLEACPTGALVEPYVMDASRCISYFTIELRGAIPSQFRSKIGGNVFGCDICQDVCPWNRTHQLSVLSDQQAPSGREQSLNARKVARPATTTVQQFYPMTVEPSPRGVSGGATQRATDSGPRTTGSAGFSLFNPPLETLASLSEEDFRRIFAHSPIKRTKYRSWLRNLAVAMGNSGNERFVRWLEWAAQHPDPIVREHAAWALDRLRGG